MKQGDDAMNQIIMTRYLNHGVMVCRACRQVENEDFEDYKLHDLIRSMRPDLKTKAQIRELATEVKLLITRKNMDD